MREVDARGLSCPLPVMRTEEAIYDKAQEIRVFVDSGTAKANVMSQLADAGYTVTVSDDGDDWTIEAQKT